MISFEKIVNRIAYFELGCALFYQRRSLKKQINPLIRSIYEQTAQTEYEHYNQWCLVTTKKTISYELFKIEAVEGIHNNPRNVENIREYRPDGICRKYNWSRWFFKNKHAQELPDEVILAAAIPGEWVVAIAYYLLSIFSPKYRALSYSLSQEERTHSYELYLLSQLACYLRN